MTEATTPTEDAAQPRPEPARLSPLVAIDPPKVNAFWLDARLAASPSGVAYVAHDATKTPVMMILLSQGAAKDPVARDRLAGTVNRMHIDTVVARGGEGQDSGRLAVRYRAPVDAPDGAAFPAPWVALAYDGTQRAVEEAERILAEVDLSWRPLQGDPAGPAYQLHWVDKTAPGTVRLWPLPWPGRHDRAGALSILASWLIMLLLTALAVLVAILLFQGAPVQAPPPPVPTEGSAPPDSSSPSPESASPSPESGSPSPESASPSPESASPSPESAQPSPGESAGGGSPTPNSKL